MSLPFSQNRTCVCSIFGNEAERSNILFVKCRVWYFLSMFCIYFHFLHIFIEINFHKSYLKYALEKFLSCSRICFEDVRLQRTQIFGGFVSMQPLGRWIPLSLPHFFI